MNNLVKVLVQDIKEINIDHWLENGKWTTVSCVKVQRFDTFIHPDLHLCGLCCPKSSPDFLMFSCDYYHSHQRALTGVWRRHSNRQNIYWLVWGFFMLQMFCLFSHKNHLVRLRKKIINSHGWRLSDILWKVQRICWKFPQETPCLTRPNGWKYPQVPLQISTGVTQTVAGCLSAFAGCNNSTLLPSTSWRESQLMNI